MPKLGDDSVTTPATVLPPSKGFVFTDDPFRGVAPLPRALPVVKDGGFPKPPDGPRVP
jgi:hypothetical protein